MNAFSCASSVQIMRAIQLKMTEKDFEGDADIFISTMFSGAEIVAKNLQKERLFNRVVIIDYKTLDAMSLAKIVYGNSILSKNIKKNSYVKLIAFNIAGKQISALFNLNRKNKGFEYHCVEDGPGIYMIPEYPDYSLLHPYRFLGFQHAYFHITNWWTSAPDYITVPECYHTQKKRLPPIDYKNNELVGIINEVFGYEENKSLLNADILFMDESHYQDGLMIDDADYKLYMEIIRRYPDAKYLMKMHPRTKMNRYIGKIEIMENDHIPWEVYVMNRARKASADLIQISVCCTTMYSDKLMFDYEGTKVFIAPLFYDKIRLGNDNAPRVSPEMTTNIERFKKTYINPNQFAIVYSEDELFATLDQKLKGKIHNEVST